MKILLCHNRYRQPGGEDRVFESERLVLAGNGFQVRSLELSNDDIGSHGTIPAFLGSLWSYPSYRKALQIIREFKPDVVHIHNFFAALSPSIYWAASQEGAAVVQTIHNYRLLCPEANFFRHGSACELCPRQRSFLPAIRYACYRHSAAASAAVAVMNSIHWYAGTWASKIDRLIVLSHFAERRFIDAGFPATLIAVKPNCLAADGFPRDGIGDHFAYVGRLSEEKGPDFLLDAWLSSPGLPDLVAVGSGPLETSLRQSAASDPRINMTGALDHQATMSIIRRARAIVIPSRCFEGFPTVLLEAFSAGVPVIAPDHGAFTELITDGVNGRLFSPGSRESLLAAVNDLHRNPDSSARMGKRCRQEYLDKYSTAKNLSRIAAIYREAIEHAAVSAR